MFSSWKFQTYVFARRPKKHNRVLQQKRRYRPHRPWRTSRCFDRPEAESAARYGSRAGWQEEIGAKSPV